MESKTAEAADQLQALKIESGPAKNLKEESLVLDFTSTFKQDTKAGKSFKKKKKPVLPPASRGGREGCGTLGVGVPGHGRVGGPEL